MCSMICIRLCAFMHTNRILLLSNHLLIQRNLSEILQSFVNREYENDVSVVVTDYDLTNNSVFKLYLVGVSANETLQELLNDISSSRLGLNIGIGVLNLCDQNCTSSTSESNDQKDKATSSQLVLIVLVSLFVAFSVLLIIISLLTNYMR